MSEYRVATAPLLHGSLSGPETLCNADYVGSRASEIQGNPFFGSRRAALSFSNSLLQIIAHPKKHSGVRYRHKLIVLSILPLFLCVSSK